MPSDAVAHPAGQALMKRSKAMRLVLIGSTPLMLAGCGQSHPGNLYRSEAPCIAAGFFTPDLCPREFAPTKPGTQGCNPFSGRCSQQGTQRAAAGTRQSRDNLRAALAPALRSTNRGGFGAGGYSPSRTN